MSYIGRKPSFSQVRTAELAIQRATDITTAGVIAALSVSDISLVRLTAATELQGIAAPSSPVNNGKRLTIINARAGDLTVKNESTSATAANRVITGISRDLVVSAGASVTFVYNTASSRWSVESSSGEIDIDRLKTAVQSIAVALDLAPTASPKASVYELTAGSGNSIRSISAGVSGQFIVLVNKSGSTVFLSNEASAATAANRILTGTGNFVELKNNASVFLSYLTDSSANSRWQVVSVSGIEPSLDPVEVAGIPPSLDLDFSSDVPSTVTFSRNSIATYFDEDGYLKTASANVPRIEYDPVTRDVKGLLIEEAISNLITYSEQFDNAAWVKSNTSVGINSIVAPDGTMTADLIIGNTSSSAQKYIRNDYSTTTTGNYTLSFFLKAGTESSVVVRVSDNTGTNGALVSVNLSTGTLGSVTQTGANTNSRAVISSIGNDWYKVSITTTFVSALTQIQSAVWLQFYGNSTATTYFYVWNAQLEAGAFPTSYIPSQQTWTARTGTGGTAVASYYDSTGLLKFTGTARTTYNPSPDKLHLSPKLLLEPEATNSFLQSENLAASWGITRGAVSASATTTPDGSTASKNIVFTANTAANSAYIYQSYTTTANTPFTVSIFIKRPTSGTPFTSEIKIIDATDNATAYFTPETNTVYSVGTTIINKSFQTLPNGWFRLIATFLPTTSSSRNIAILFESVTGTESMWYWGAQLEAGYAPTSYIPTTTATVKRYADTYTSASVTRQTDNASMTGSNFTGWYRWDEGTVYCEGDRNALTSTRFFSIHDGTSQNQIRFTSTISGTQLRADWQILSAGITQANIFSQTLIDIGQPFSIAGTYKFNDFQQATNSVLGVADASGIVPLPNQISIGSNEASGSIINGHIRRLIFWPLRIDNDKLRIMTK